MSLISKAFAPYRIFSRDRSRFTLTAVHMPRLYLDGTPYGRAIARRLEILLGQSQISFPQRPRLHNSRKGLADRFHRYPLRQKKDSRSFAAEAASRVRLSLQLHHRA